MKNSIKTLTNVTLAIAASFSVACTVDDAANPPPAIRPAKANDATAPGGFLRGRVYKGDWRPLVDCQSTSGAKLHMDLWEGAIHMGRGKESLKPIWTSEDLIGRQLGTNRVWEFVGAPVQIADHTRLRLQLDAFGKGNVYAPRSSSDCTTPGSTCREWVVKYDCSERPMPYEQKFVEAACQGDAAYVENFMAQYPNVPDYINQIGSIGETALTCAVKQGRASVVTALLNRRSSGLDFSASNLRGETPLFLDLDQGAGRASEWLRRSDVDPTRLDNKNRTILHSRSGNLALLRTVLQLPSDRFKAALLNVADDQRTTALGAVVEREWGKEDAQTAFLIGSRAGGAAVDAPAIKGRTYLEHALESKSPGMAAFFFLAKPAQKIASADYVNLLPLLAAESCDERFVRALPSRSELNLNARNRDGQNAIDIVRRVQCRNSTELIRLLVGMKVVDRLDPVPAACSFDAGAFNTSLQSGGTVAGRTNEIFQCIWNRADLLRVMLRHPNAGWEWSVIEGYAIRALQAKDATLTGIYLNEMKWQQTTGLVTKLKAAVTDGTITSGQYVEALESQRSLTNDNLRVGKYDHLVFDVIEVGDARSLERILSVLGSSNWPSLDSSKAPGAVDFYRERYAELATNSGCTLPASVTEEPVRFAIRLGKTEAALAAANQMRRASARLSTPTVACGGTSFRLMNALSLAVQTCSTELVTAVAGLADGSVDGAGLNELTRASALDAIARARACSSDQVTRMARAYLQSVSMRDESEIPMDGPHSELVARLLSESGYQVRPVIVPPGLPKPYVAASIGRQAAALFARRDQRLEASNRMMLDKTGSSGTWLDYRLKSVGAITFRGLSDVALFAPFETAQLRKRNNCLEVTHAGALQMRESTLAIEQLTVCPTSLRFKFNPTTAERSLPIRDHVDGEFEFSLEGVQ